jgi:O-antigen/teichoic acid export membrane protein
MKFSVFIKNNLLLKVTSTNAIVVFVRMGFSVISQKVLAILIGAEGIALVGNLKNVSGLLTQFATLGSFNGLVKYISEFKNDRTELNKLFSTTIFFIIIASIISFVVLFFGAHYLNNILFGADKNYSFIFKILAFLVPFMGLATLFNGLVNGISAYKVYAKITITTIILSTVLIVLFTVLNNIKGSLLAIALIPLIQFLSIIFFFSNKLKRYINLKKLSFKVLYQNKLLSYSIMTLIAVLSINFTDIAIRKMIETNIGVNDAGYWTAMTSISNNYMNFTAIIFPLYILPKYSQITSSFQFKKEVLNIYKMILPIVALGMILIFVFKNILVQLLYSESFMEMSNLFKWQLIGDFVKLIALVLAYQFLAKKQLTNFVFTEVFSVILFYGFSKYFIQFYGTEGVVLAHFVRYVLYFILVLFILRHKLFGKERVL